MQVLAEAGGIYSTHVRNETDLAKESIAEAMNAVRGLKVPLHISHLKIAGSSYWGGAPKSSTNSTKQDRRVSMSLLTSIHTPRPAPCSKRCSLPGWQKAVLKSCCAVWLTLQFAREPPGI